jgi:hypothetical protein
MKRIIANIFLLIVYLIGEQFFDIATFKYEGNDIILVLSLIFVAINANNFLLFIKRHFYLVLFLFLLFIVNFITSTLNYNQPLIYSFKTGRFLITYIFIAFGAFTFVKYNSNKDDYIPLIIPAIVIALNYYAYFTQNFEIFNKNLYVSERFDDTRFMVAGTSVIYLVIYYSNRIHQKLIYSILFLLLLSVLIVISKTRGIIFPILLTFLFSSEIKSILRFKKNTFYLVFGIIVVIFIFGNNFIKFLSEAFNFTVDEFQSNENNNIQIRFAGYIYYWDILKESFLSVFFGNGTPSGFTVNRFEENLYLSDIGAFKILFNHGILGILIILKIILRTIKNKALFQGEKLVIFNDAKLFSLFQLFSLLSLTFFFKTPAIIFFFIIYMKSSQIEYESRRANNQL